MLMQSLEGKSDSESAVELACWSGHFDILEELLDRAAKLGFSEVSVFLRAGPAERDLLSRVLDLANLDLEGKEGTELLAGAGSMNQLFADALISRGAQPDILTACRLGRADHVERLIEQKPALLNAAETGYPHSTPISVAVSNGQAAIVQLLINQGVTLPEPNSDSGSLIHQAANRGHLDVLKLLLRNGYTLDAKTSAGSTLLHSAASGRRPDVARYLITREARVNASNFRGVTPLHELGTWIDGWFPDEDDQDKQRRTLETAKILLDAGADINAKDQSERTPLHDAVSSGSVPLVKLLLDRGARVNARDCRYQTPLGYAGRRVWQRSFDKEASPVAELLRKHGGIE